MASILCFQCDWYIPEYLGFWFKEPKIKQMYWGGEVEYTGQCHSCKSSHKTLREIWRSQYAY